MEKLASNLACTVPKAVADRVPLAPILEGLIGKSSTFAYKRHCVRYHVTKPMTASNLFQGLWDIHQGHLGLGSHHECHPVERKKQNTNMLCWQYPSVFIATPQTTFPIFSTFFFGWLPIGFPSPKDGGKKRRSCRLNLSTATGQQKTQTADMSSSQVSLLACLLIPFYSMFWSHTMIYLTACSKKWGYPEWLSMWFYYHILMGIQWLWHYPFQCYIIPIGYPLDTH